MVEWDISLILIIILLGFLAAFIDAVVGGGGLISIPALLAIGMPPAVALGTNKLASVFGSATSAFRFLRSGKVDLAVVAKLFPFVFIFSIIGASLATFLPAELLKPIVIVVLTIVMIYTLIKKDWGSIRTYSKLTVPKAIIFTAFMSLIGFYDGFLGGGTGSFMLFVLLMFGFDFLILFISLGHVDYFYSFIMAASMIVVSYIGAMFAIKKGVGYVKVLFVSVTAILIVKSAYDYFQNIL